MEVKSKSKVTQSCPTLHDAMEGSPPGSSIHGIFQARVLEWGAIAFSVNASYTNVIRIVDINKIPNIETQALLLLGAYKI